MLQFTTDLEPPATEQFYGRTLPVVSYATVTDRQAARLKFHHALSKNDPAAARDHLAALDDAIQAERGRD
jgi:hypothetical protein